MVMDSVVNAQLYNGLGERIAMGLKYIKENSFTDMEPGKYEIDGSNIYALILEYESKPVDTCKWESHRRYIDIQYVVKGFERIGYSNIDSMRICEEYNEEKDYMFLEGEGNYFHISVGTFAIFGPQDAHMVGIAAGEPGKVKKVVLKILV